MAKKRKEPKPVGGEEETRYEYKRGKKKTSNPNPGQKVKGKEATRSE